MYFKANYPFNVPVTGYLDALLNIQKANLKNKLIKESQRNLATGAVT